MCRPILKHHNFFRQVKQLQHCFVSFAFYKWTLKKVRQYKRNIWKLKWLFQGLFWAYGLIGWHRPNLDRTLSLRDCTNVHSFGFSITALWCSTFAIMFVLSVLHCIWLRGNVSWLVTSKAFGWRHLSCESSWSAFAGSEMVRTWLVLATSHLAWEV